jgi:hypothetical protein
MILKYSLIFFKSLTTMNPKLLALVLLGLYVKAQDDTENFGDDVFVADDEVTEGEDVFAAAEEEVNKEAASLPTGTKEKAAVSVQIPFFFGEDAGPTWIGVTSVIGIIWWFVWGWFVYLPQNTADSTMQFYNYSSGVIGYAVPISWFWSNTQNPTMGWTSAVYLSTFLGYLLIAVPEFIFWIMFLVNAEGGPWLFKMWATWPGYYGCWFFYLFPIIFAIVQMAQNNGDINLPGWSNSIIQIVMHLLYMSFTGVVHIMALPSLIKKVDEVMDPSYQTRQEKYAAY